MQVREIIDYYGYLTQTEAKGTSSSKSQEKREGLVICAHSFMNDEACEPYSEHDYTSAN